MEERAGPLLDLLALLLKALDMNITLGYRAAPLVRG
jgi:hypothetical protein